MQDDEESEAVNHETNGECEECTEPASQFVIRFQVHEVQFGFVHRESEKSGDIPNGPNENTYLEQVKECQKSGGYDIEVTIRAVMLISVVQVAILLMVVALIDDWYLRHAQNYVEDYNDHHLTFGLL